MHNQTHTAATTLIVGLGKTGLSCARFLTDRQLEFSITDSRIDPPGLEQLQQQFPDVPCRVGGFDQQQFNAAKMLILSPGVAIANPVVQQAVAHGAEVIGDIELFAREVSAPVAAITGSNGKSTVTTLLGEMAAVEGLNLATGGNLGEPALDLLKEDKELYVMELSSFQLETTFSLKDHVAVVLNISPDHMDRYADLDDYVAAKTRVYANARIRLFNRDDAVVAALQGLPEKSDRWFGLSAPINERDFGLRQVDGVKWLCQGKNPWIAASELLIPGSHNIANALAALALGDALGLSRKAMLTALRGFRGLEHRTQLIAEIKNVRWYNDSKATNAGACIAALEGFQQAENSTGQTLLIAGGDCKDADFTKLARVISQTVGVLILIGRDAPQIEQAVQHRVPTHSVQSLEEAVSLAAKHSNPGDRVLLSPACASFDMFENYQQRGERFQHAVIALEEMAP